MNTIISREVALELGAERFFTGKPCRHGHLSERAVSDSRCIECRTLKDQKRAPMTEEQKAARREWEVEYRKTYAYKATRESPTVKESSREADRKRRSDPARKDYMREYYAADEQKAKRREWEVGYRQEPSAKLRNQKKHIRQKEAGLQQQWQQTYRSSGKFRDTLNKRRQTTEFKLATFMRNSLRRCLNGATKTARTSRMLGYWTDELRAHLTHRLTLDFPGVTLAQALTEGWHVDHIVPLAYWVTLDLPLGAMSRQANALANLRLIPATENLRKGHKL